MIHFKFNMMWILLQLYNDSGLWTMLRAMLGCSSPRVTSTNVHSRWELQKNSLQEHSKPDLRMERPDQQTSKPSSLILRFLHQNIHAATIFPLKSFVDVILIKSIFLLLPILATNQILKVPTIFPGWDGGGGVSWSSLSRLRGRNPISSGFPSPPFINLFCLSENLFVCNLIILLFRISAKCSPTWYYQKLNLAQVWSSESSNNPDHCKCLLLQHHQHICWWGLYDICVLLSHITNKWVSRSCTLLDQGDPRWLAHQTWARYFYIGFEWPQIMT